MRFNGRIFYIYKAWSCLLFNFLKCYFIEVHTRILCSLLKILKCIYITNAETSFFPYFAHKNKKPKKKRKKKERKKENTEITQTQNSYASFKAATVLPPLPPRLAFFSLPCMAICFPLLRLFLFSFLFSCGVGSSV